MGEKRESHSEATVHSLKILYIFKQLNRSPYLIKLSDSVITGSTEKARKAAEIKTGKIKKKERKQESLQCV